MGNCIFILFYFILFIYLFINFWDEIFDYFCHIILEKNFENFVLFLNTIKSSLLQNQNRVFPQTSDIIVGDG
jgi:hypothetical protein